MGINSGLVVAGTVGDGRQTGVMGDAVNVAARLQQSADPGEILLSASTWRRVRDAFEADAIGELEVKGKAQPVGAYRLVGRRAIDLRHRAPFVGRREEVALLELLWANARRGNTHVVSVVGEPGVGKSRLLAEFARQPGSLDVRVACSSERAFGPFIDTMERILGGSPRDAGELEAKAAALGIEQEDAAPVAALLGLADGDAPAGEQRKQQLFAGVWRFLLAACRERPAFLALDDLHWADESSLELLAFLLERLGGVPLLLVVTYRPGFQEVERSEHRASHTAIHLEPLDPAESVALARGFLGVEELPADLERLVAERAGGNPFFIQELLQALLELGSLAVVGGHAVLARLEVEVPDTVQGTILARVDRLDPAARSLLQHAAVVGRGFRRELLEEILGEGDLSEHLAALARAQLVVEPSPGEWAFKHALIQEVTYETLLLRRRQELHRKVAQALERRASDDPDLLESLAEHYTRADAPEKARRYAVAAGDVARERAGFREATRRYRAALGLWGEGDPVGRLELLTKLGHAASVAGEPDKAQAALVEAAEGWSELGEDERAGAALTRLGNVYWLRGEVDRAAETLERAIALLAGRPSAELVEAYNWASRGLVFADELERGVEFAQRGVELARELGLEGQRAHFLNTLGLAQDFAGEPLESERLLEEALALARRTGEIEALGRTYNNLAAVVAFVRGPRRTLELAREGRTVMQSFGASGWPVNLQELGALVALGRLDEADALAGDIVQRHGRVQRYLGSVVRQRAIVALRRGDYDRARALFEDVRGADSESGPEVVWMPLGEAELEAACGNGAAARQAARRAAAAALATSSRWPALPVLHQAVRILTREELEPVLARAGEIRPHLFGDAVQATAEGVIHGDRERSLQAAELWRTLEMPYEEAWCRIEAGELDRARELVESFGFSGGPLGETLAAASSAARS